MAIGPVTGSTSCGYIGPVVFDIRYITNEYTKICGLRNLVSTEETLSSIILRKARFPYQHVIAIFLSLTASLNTKKINTHAHTITRVPSL